MDALHGPIVHTGGSEGATVAAAVVEYAPCIAEVVAVLPQRGQHVLVRVGMLLVEPIGNQPNPIALIGTTLRRRHQYSLQARFLTDKEYKTFRAEAFDSTGVEDPFNEVEELRGF